MSLAQTIQKIRREGFTPEIRSRYTKDELIVLGKVLEEYEEHGSSPTLDALWKNDFEVQPVTIDQFLEDDYYLGRIGCDVYDLWRDDLRTVLSPFNNIGEWVIKGSIGCVTGDTKIPLLDGSCPRIDELVGREEFWVYSVNRDSSRIEGAKGFNARRTGESVAIYAVELDNGEVVKATADHRFMLRDGSYERVENLAPGDSLMPLYRTQSPLSTRSKARYDKFLDLNGRWVWTHRRVAQQLYGSRYWTRKGNWQIHHADFDSLNNTPSNLELLLKEDHFKKHGAYAREQLQKWRDSFDTREDYIDVLRPRLLKGCHNRWNGVFGEANREIASLSTSIRMMDGQAAAMSAKAWSNPSRRLNHKRYMEEFNSSRHPNLRDDITVEKLIEACLTVSASDGTMTDVAKYLGCSRTRCYVVARDHLSLHFRDLWVACGGTLRTNSVGRNHKVASVRFFGHEDVYDIEVEGTRNYATEAGVFIHNSGKTFVAVLALLYKIHYLLCLRSPQKFYGLAEGSPIVFGLFNIYKYLVQATSYQYLTTWLRDMSPYFKSFRVIDPKRPYKRETDKALLSLPKGINIALGAVSIHALGQNLIGGLLDETEFGKAKSMTSGEKSQVADLYHNVRTRIDSRFLQRGGLNPGLLCLVSSARDHAQFLSQHVKAVQNDEHTHVSQYALYEIKHHVYKDSPRFEVVVGDKLNRSYIVDDQPEDQPIRADAVVLEVPIEFLPRYRYDLDTAVRDISGVETYGKTLFLARRDILLEALATSTPREHPFSKEEITLSLQDETSIEDYFLKDRILTLFDKTNKLYRPRFYPSADRFIHVDLAKNRDACGIAMGCISETKSIKRFTPEGLPVNAKDYVFFADLMLRIRAGHGSEIDFSKIRRFIFFLQLTCRFPIKWVSYDSYQSTDSIQIFKKEGVQAKELSVDKKPGPYRAFRSVILEGRWDWYYYEPFFEEISTLEDHSMEEGKPRKPLIDHPLGGSKDVSDAVCGFINGALISKGVEITGTDAHAMQQRAAVNKEIMDERVRKQRSLDDPGFVQGDYKKKNPLDSLFDD